MVLHFKNATDTYLYEYCLNIDNCHMHSIGLRNLFINYFTKTLNDYDYYFYECHYRDIFKPNNAHCLEMHSKY